MANTPESILRALVESPRWPSGSISYHELQGYLFALASAPGAITPAAWMPITAPLVRCASPEEVDECKSALMAVVNSVRAAALEDRVTLPDDCPLREPPLANFEGTAPVALWSRGFMMGHRSMQAEWDTHFPKQAWEQLEAVLITLSFFGSRSFAERLCREGRSDVSEVASATALCFPTAISSYAYYGRMLRLSMSARGVGVVSNKAARPGRNEPCPCGSGRKYKKCCGASADRRQGSATP